jgi:putative ABC transport system permease protein
MKFERQLFNLEIAFEAIQRNKLRSFLTSLGIIFGVAAVISMLAIGNGAKQEILERLKLVGVNNIVISPIIEQKQEDLQQTEDSQNKQTRFSPGLNLLDMQAIREILPSVESVSPEIVIETSIISKAVKRSVKLIGIESDYFSVFGFEFAQGKTFAPIHLEVGTPVCVVGSGIKKRFFPNEDALGKSIKCGSHWLKIIGVLQQRSTSDANLSKLGIRDVNMDVYVPLQTALVRYTNRSLVTAASIREAEDQDEDSPNQKAVNYHQLDKLVVNVKQTWQMSPTAEAISRMLKRRHNGVVDYEISIPELLIKQEQRTKDIFNVVLGAIAGISLLAATLKTTRQQKTNSKTIGIMNIMLASVLERTKEIGLRKSLGAKSQDIIVQFLFEAVMISVSGGILGIIFGVLLSWSIATLASIPSLVSSSSILVSFSVAAGVGLVFGIAPARRAAQQDPISSLRYE